MNETLSPLLKWESFENIKKQEKKEQKTFRTWWYNALTILPFSVTETVAYFCAFCFQHSYGLTEYSWANWLIWKTAKKLLINPSVSELHSKFQRAEEFSLFILFFLTHHLTSTLPLPQRTLRNVPSEWMSLDFSIILPWARLLRPVLMFKGYDYIFSHMQSARLP